ncbi:MAG: hypothetical protein CSYNP_01148 [Syntrophus sp. SKADARSKE-3]|nr:hypothetical protein [Syntrophus sp. SKADARSKE-3]
MLDSKKVYFIMIMFFITGMASVYLQGRGGNLQKKLSLPLNLPMDISGWHGSVFSAPMPKEVEPDDFILRAYQLDNGRQINMLALYSRISNYHPPALCYQGSGRQLTDIQQISSSSGRIRLAGLMGKRDSDTILVYHGFYIGGKIVPDGIQKKIFEMHEKLINGFIDQYFFEVTVDVFNNDEVHANSYIKRFLDHIEPYLIGAAGH